VTLTQRTASTLASSGSVRAARSSSGENAREARCPIGEMIHQVGRVHR
jgi:hypothetical protein